MTWCCHTEIQSAPFEIAWCTTEGRARWRSRSGTGALAYRWPVAAAVASATAVGCLRHYTAYNEHTAWGRRQIIEAA